MSRTPLSYVQRRLGGCVAMAAALLVLSQPTSLLAQSEPGSDESGSEESSSVDSTLERPAVQPHEMPDAVDDAEAASWWTPWYLVDYGLIAAGTTAFVVGEEMEPANEALIGPIFRADDPSSLYVRVDAAEVNRVYRPEGSGELVPKEWVIGAIGGATLYLGGLEGYAWAHGYGSAQQFHDTMVGYLEATALTAGVTNLIKPTVGRLRPDFGTRARHYLCTTNPPPDLDCDGYRLEPLSDDPAEAQKLFLDGRRSFVSGHSSNSFSVFGYTSLVIGGHYVWGDDATPRSRAAGIAAQSVLMGTASFIAASRVIDGRHHPSDVLTGAGIGLAIANFAYWRRFGLDGDPHDDSFQMAQESDLAFDLGPSPNGAGLQLTIRHP